MLNVVLIEKDLNLAWASVSNGMHIKTPDENVLEKEAEVCPAKSLKDYFEFTNSSE